MLQDIPERLDISFSPADPKPDDPVLCYRDGGVLTRGGQEALCFPTADLFENSRLTWLFRVGGTSYYWADVPPAKEDMYEPRPLRSLRGAVPQSLAFAAVTGRHLAYWYTHQRYCGVCGERTVPGDRERSLICPKCGSVYYPTIAPAVIIGVTRGDRLLVSRYAGRPYKGLALLAGYVEIGETLEDAVRREVMEEVGLRVHALRYHKSQPWGFDHNLLMGFFCEADENDDIRVDHDELAEAWWAGRQELMDLPDSASLTFDMMRTFRDRR